MANTNRPNRGTLITVYRAVILVLIIAIAAGTLFIATRETPSSCMCAEVRTSQGYTRETSQSCVSAEVRTSQGYTFGREGKLVTAEGVVRLDEQDSTMFTLEKDDKSSIKDGRVVYKHSARITPTILDYEGRLKEMDGRKAQVVYYDNGGSWFLVAWNPTGA